VTAAALVGAGWLAWTIAVLALIVLFVLWLYCLVDIVTSGERGIGSKILWSLVTIVAAPLAIPVYLLFARSHSTP
jgi:Phospholipase_D-nuclease N-terminal